MSRPQNARQTAFSMMELLVAILIVSVLAVLALVTASGVQRSAMALESASNLRQLAQANLAYATDSGRFAPANDRWNRRRWHGVRTSPNAPFNPAGGFLSPYLGESGEVMACPLFEQMTGSASFELGAGGYGYNQAYIGGRPGGAYDSSTGIRIAERVANVTDPTQTVMFTTTAYARSGGLQEYPYCEPPFWDFGTGPSGHRPSPSVHFRFRGKAIVAWCDGHVSFESMDDRPHGSNPHGGDSESHALGWFGPDQQNGWWRARR